MWEPLKIRWGLSILQRYKFYGRICNTVKSKRKRRVKGIHEECDYKTAPFRAGEARAMGGRAENDHRAGSHCKPD